MGSAIDLSDPTFEPSDEELEGLAARAFAGVRAAHEQSLERLRAEIARERERVLAALAEPAPGGSDPRGGAPTP